MSSSVSDDQQAIEWTRTETDSDIAMSRDGFEDLPEAILLHILSFLPTEIAVRASVLSKRWKSLWKDVPNLDLELRGYRVDQISINRFQNFVDKVLQHRASPTVNKFKLYCGENVDPHHMSRWIDYAVSHSVQDLSIGLYINDIHIYCDAHNDDCRFPKSLFTCKSVVKFKLHATIALRLPSLIRFSNLKILTLEYVTFFNQHRINQFFSNCPVLEELMLYDCCWDCQSVHICCPRLARLVIKQGDDDGIGSECQIVIHGTSLKFFHYVGECEIECCLVDSHFLVEAYIDIRPAGYSETIVEERQLEVVDRAHKILQGLYNVEYLAISSQALQILKYKEDSFSKMSLFRNLTHLRVYGGPVDIEPHSGLLNFLRACPSVDHLEFIEGVFFGFDSSSRTDDLELPPFPECFITTIKTLTVHKFYGRFDERCVVKFWLMIARALENLCVNFLCGQEELNEFLILLQDLPMSALCRLCFHEPLKGATLDFGPFSVLLNDQ